MDKAESSQSSTGHVCAWFDRIELLCRSESPKGLEVYLHALQLLTTIDEGIQMFGEGSNLFQLRGGTLICESHLS